jgi:hypothetical protein
MALQSVQRKGWRAFAPAAASLLALAAVLAGCNPSQRQPASPQTPPRLEPGAPQALAPSGRSFFFNDDPERASLTYGVGGTDDVDVMLECAPRSRRIEITDVVHPAQKGQMLILISGAARADLPAKVQADEEAGRDLASAKAASDLAPLTAFRATGKLSVGLGGRTLALSASASEMTSVTRFFAVCERR